MMNKTPPTTSMPNTEETQTMMKNIMEHYSLHYDVILKKLDHAQTATNQSMEAANEWDMKVIGGYDSAWKDIINMFQTCGISQEELFEIEKILVTLPENIRGHFERLITMDKMLQTMITTMEKLNYNALTQTIQAVQNQTNPMSGLGPEEYDIAESKPDAAVKAFKIIR